MTESVFAPRITDDIVKLHHDYFVPAVYAQWAHHIIDLSAIELGQSILDVACGTGTLSRAAKLETGLKGRVVGLDTDERMLNKARKQGAGIEWQIGDVAQLPFEDNEFDRVTCQFALMFIKNKVAAIKEMLRVCKPDGYVCIAVLAPISHSKAYATLLDLTRKFAGLKVVNDLSQLWSLGETGKMDSLLLSAGVNKFECHERPGIATFPSIETFVEAHLRAFSEFYSISGDTFNEMLKAAHRELKPYVIPGGRLAAELDADIFIVRPV